MRTRPLHKFTVTAWAALTGTATAAATHVLLPIRELVATLQRSALPLLILMAVVVGLVLLVDTARAPGRVCSAHHNHPCRAHHNPTTAGEVERWQAATAVAVLAASVGGADPAAVASTIHEARSNDRFTAGADALTAHLARAGNEWSGASGVAWAWAVLDALDTPGIGAGIREVQ